MTASVSPKRAVFEQFAVVAQALANGNRVELIEILAQGERSVDVLAKLSGLRLTNVSQHLQLLRRAGLIVARRSGKQILYQLADRDVVGGPRSVATLKSTSLCRVIFMPGTRSSRCPKKNSSI